MTRLPTIFLGVWVTAWATGCTQPPTAQIIAAKAKLETVAFEGVTYGPDAYKAAQDVEAQLDAELKAQDEKLSIFRSYDRARELAASAETAADHVQQTVTAEKTRLRAETGRVVADAKRELAQAKQLFEKIPQGQLLGLKSAMAKAETSLGEADSLLSAGRPMEAHRLAKTAFQTVTQTKTAIEQAQAVATRTAARRAAPDDVLIPQVVLADGKPLPTGTYRTRLTDEAPSSVVGQTAGSERWVEFVQNGTVAGRELAVVLSADEMSEVAKGPGPALNDLRVDLLKGSEYVRLWLNREGTNYLIYMPVAPR